MVRFGAERFETMRITDCKGLIYDWDGVAYRSVETTWNGVLHVFDRCGMTKPDFRDFIEHADQPIVSFYRKFGILGHIPERRIGELFSGAVQHRRDTLFDDIRFGLAEQRDHGYPVSLVTARHSRSLNRLLDEHGCRSLFDHILATNGRDKRPFLLEACRRMQLAPKLVATVGDQASDMRQGRECGLFPVGMIRHRHDVEDILRRAGARHVVRDIDTITRLLTDHVSLMI